MMTETPRHIESSDSAGFKPVEVPAGVLALLETPAGADPGVAIELAGIRTIPLLIIPESTLPPPEPPPGEPDIKPPPRIGGHLEPAEIIKQTLPVYPPLARTARVEGVVVIEARINVSGNLENIHVIDGHPLLVDEALRTVKKWKYRPAILNGQPVPSPVSITVRFTLQYPGSPRVD